MLNTTLAWEESGGIEKNFRVLGLTNYTSRNTYMRTVRVKKNKLLTTIKHNRNQHRQMFEAANVGFREALIVELDRMLADASAGRRVRTTIDLPAPVDQTREYDRVIAQLEMETREEIELSDEEFANYVMDDWRWKQQVLGLAASYTDPGEAVVDMDGLTTTTFRPKKFR